MSRRTSVKRPEGAKSKDTGVNHVEDVPEVVQPREIKRAKAAAGGSPVAPAATAKAVPASSPVATKPSYVNTRRSIFAPHLQRLTRAEKIITSALASTLFTKKIPLYGPAPSVSEDGIALVPVDESDGSVPPTDTVFYVKWKRLSHVHCCWVTRAVVECSDPHAQRLAIAEKFGLMEYCPVGLVSASAPVKPASRDSDVSDSESEEDIDDDISIQASITSCELGDPVAGVGEVTGDDLEHVDALLTSARKGSRMMLRNFLNSDAAEDSVSGTLSRMLRLSTLTVVV